MTIGEMHYDFKQKLNAIDSQKYNGLKVPEIDWKLNEAQEVYVKNIAQPQDSINLGFETDQRSIDDIRTIVIDQQPNEYITAVQFDDTSYIIPLPDDYWFFANINVFATKGNCVNVPMYNSRIVQHNDKSENSPFDRSSFEWRICNFRYNNQGIRLFTDGTFVVTKVGLEYLIQPTPMYNAAAYLAGGGSYNTINGVTLTGTQDCILPEQTHRDIVDLAVLITTGDLSLSNYPIKKDKLNITKQ